MVSDIFISDFEITENTESIHAVLGRALIIATRFDSMCEAAAIALEIKKNTVLSSLMTEEEYEDRVKAILSKYRTLNGNIKSIGLPNEFSVILHDARKARNNVAHELSKGLTGCLDRKIAEADLIKEVSELVLDIAFGDIAISYVISLFNKEPTPRIEYIESYKNSIVQWVIEREVA